MKNASKKNIYFKILDPSIDTNFTKVQHLTQPFSYGRKGKKNQNGVFVAVFPSQLKTFDCIIVYL